MPLDGVRGLTNRLLYTERGQIVCSVMVGFAIALLFRKVCNDRTCRIILAPPLDHVKSTVFQLEDECYTYKPIPVACPAIKDIIVPTNMDGLTV